MTSPLRHLPMSEQPAVRSQIRVSLQAPPIPPWPCHGDDVIETNRAPFGCRQRAAAGLLAGENSALPAPIDKTDSVLPNIAVNIIDVLLLFQFSAWYNI